MPRDLTADGVMQMQAGLNAMNYYVNEMPGMIDGTFEQGDALRELIRVYQGALHDKFGGASGITEGSDLENLLRLILDDNCPTETGLSMVSYIVDNAHLREEVLASLNSADPERIRLGQGIMTLLGETSVAINGTVDPETANAAANYLLQDDSVPETIGDINSNKYDIMIFRMLKNGQMYMPDPTEFDEDLLREEAAFIYVLRIFPQIIHLHSSSTKSLS